MLIPRDDMGTPVHGRNGRNILFPVWLESRREATIRRIDTLPRRVSAAHFGTEDK